MTNYPVTTSTGNFWHTFNDVSVAGRGPGLNLSRTYNSAAAGLDSPFGPGWSSSYTMSATANANGVVTLRQENGAEALFTPLPAGGYSAPVWVTATLFRNGDGTYTLTRHARDIVTFSSAGKMLSRRDLNGYTTSVAYNGAGQISTVTDEAGRALIFTYGANGKVASVTDPASRQVVYGYDASDRLTDVTDVAGGNTHFSYDGSHRMLTMRDPRSGLVTNHYDPVGRVDWQRDPMNRTTYLDYTSIPGSTKITHPRGNVSVHEYRRGLLVARVDGFGTADEATQRREYNTPTLGCTKRTDANNHTLIRTFDAAGNVLTSKDGLNRTTTFTYDSLNNLKTVTDANNVTTTFTYDGAGNLTGRSTPLTGTSQVQSVTFAHGDNAHPGDVTSITDADNKVWNFAYDGAGNLTQATDPFGNVTKYGHDALGRRTSIVTPRGTAAGILPGCTPPALGCTRNSYAYDPSGETVTVTDPLGRVNSHHYDRNRNVDAATDANNRTTSAVYNANDELTRLNRPEGSHLDYEYDTNGNMTAQRDGANQATTYDYDALDRVKWTKDPLLRQTSFGYDDVGNQTLITDASGRTTTMTYDAADQLKTIDYSDPGTPDVTDIAYDAVGRRLSMRTPDRTSRWEWDSLGRLKHSDDGTNPVDYGYDLRNHLTSIAQGGYPTLTRGYDNAGRWTSVNDGRGNTTTFGYDRDDNLDAQSFANGVNAINTFDNAGRLSSQADAKGASVLSSFSYGRDNKGQLTSSSATGTIQPDETYGYNPLDQLSSVNASSYSYDSADNLIRLAAGATQTYDAAHQLTSAPAGSASTLLGTTGDKPVPADYDGNGIAEAAVFQPSSGTWLIAGNPNATYWGVSGDIPVPADYTGDGKADIAVFRPSVGGWYINGAATTFWGLSGDVPVPADYDGDRKADVAVFRPTAGTWYVVPSSGGSPTTTSFGTTGDIPVPADYDGDGKTDIGVFRPGVGLWVHQSTGGNVFVTYGIAEDKPVPADYDGDGRADIAVFRPSIATWFVRRSTDATTMSVTLGSGTDTPVPARYDADTSADMATFHSGDVASWTVRTTITARFGYDAQGNRTYKAAATGGSRYDYDQANRLTRSRPFALGAARVAAGDNHNLVVDDTGAVWAWGDNNSGQTGNGTSLNNVPTPTKLTFGSSNPKIVAVTGGSQHSAALDANAKIWTWGSNISGQQATFSTGFNVPTQVSSTAFTGGGNTPTAIAAGANHTLALRAGGTVVAWGANSSGQLGDNTTNGGSILGSTVVQTSGLTNVTAVAAGGDHSLALRRDGTVWAWGSNGAGELGNGTTTNSSVPVRVGRLSGVVAIAAGRNHSLALGADGTVWAWGLNGSGQLGIGSTVSSPIPLKVSGISGVVAITAGASHSLAMRDTDSVWAWGANAAGQLGNGSTANSIVPVGSALSAATALAGGSSHSLAVVTDGSLRTWGSNSNGQMGNSVVGGTVHTPSPVPGTVKATPAATTYAYTPDGLLVSKTTSSASGATTFTWDRASGLPLMLRERLTSYVHGPGGLPLERIDGSGNVTFYHHDQLGSTRMITNASGAVAATYSYDAYGRLAASSGSVTQPFGFTGQYTDAETGFQYLRARYYDPATAQFVTRDPLEPITGTPYAYAANSPLHLVDPSGKIAFIAVVAIAVTGFEIGSSGADVINTVRTLGDDCASGWDKLLSVGGTAAGVVGPGGGYGTAARAARGATRALPRSSLPSPADAADLVRGARPVGSALKGDVHHRSATWAVDDIASSGSVYRYVGGDGVQRTLIQTPAELNGIAGRFEWIVDDGGNLTHQMFVKGGSINGVPIAP